MPSRSKRKQAPLTDAGTDASQVSTPPAAAPTPQQLAVLSTVAAQAFAGPLPPPDVLAGYDQVMPGAAERIIVMAEQQNHHRLELERLVVESDIRRANWGLVAGFVLSMTGMGVSLALALTGHAIEAAAFGAADIAALAGVFVYGTSSRREERSQRARILSGRGDQGG